MNGKLYLIPALLGDTDLNQLNPTIPLILPKIKFFFVENVKNARRYLKKIDKQIDINNLQFFEPTDKNSSIDQQIRFLTESIAKGDVGLLSDAGLPAIADPGESIILLAHQLNITIVPLVGPCSIFLALVASGLNGEQFTFHGYLPIKEKERRQQIKRIEMQSLQTQATQIFMETPYRNQQMMESLIKVCRKDTTLCVAANLTCDNEIIQTKTIEKWKKSTYNFHKQPAIFVLGAF